MNDSTFITRVVLENYKSISGCDVRLSPLTFLLGPNGSGKSNFLDALRFVGDSLRVSLDHAFTERGGVNEVRRRAERRPRHFGIRLEYRILAGFITGHYALRVGARPHGGYVVQQEECEVVSQSERSTFSINGGRVTRFELRGPYARLPAPPVAEDRLYLSQVGGYTPFEHLYGWLMRMSFYNINPESIRELQPADPGAGEVLSRDGGNIASVINRLGKTHDPAKQKIEEYLASVVPGLCSVEHRTVGPRVTLEFGQRSGASPNERRFFAASMSDGTLRALGVLVGLFQPEARRYAHIPLIGIEEPEAALHPAASGVLLDALREASEQRQILITSHSPDLLDDKNIPVESLLAVMMEGGDTQIGPLNDKGRTILRERLYTPGELLRQNLTEPEPSAVHTPAPGLLFARLDS